jgi:hypothetical protein
VSKYHPPARFEQLTVDDVLRALRDHGHCPKKSGTQWECRCPGHDDSTPSLRIGRGDTQPVVLKCMAGCPTEAVLAAIGLTFTAVSSSDSARSRPSSPSGRKRPSGPKPPAKPPDKKKPPSTIVATYRYTDEHGQLLYEVVRLEPKSFRQRRPDPANPGKWLWNMDGVPRVPYRLHELVAADKNRDIFLPEGEKDVDNLVALGLLATTNPGGAGKWDKLDPAAVRAVIHGRPVVLLPDNDDVGRKHVEEVAVRLHGIAKTIRILALPNLPSKGDVSDWLAAGGTRDQLLDLAKKTTLWTPARNGGGPPPSAGRSSARRAVQAYVPFPTHTLPACVQPFVLEHAAAIGCDEANLALAVIPALAGAIGNTIQIRLKRTWTEKAIVWAALVANSGERKSPAFRAAMRPLVEAEQGYQQEYERALAAYKPLGEEERVTADEPVCTRLLTADVTIECLAVILRENPRGVLNFRDEIDDWFQSMTRYKGAGGGTDRARWLALSNADPLFIDRKTGDPHLRRIFVPQAACSITGTIQPAILATALDELARASGLAARLLLSWPTPRKNYWSEAEVSPEVEAGYAKLIRDLLALKAAAESGRPVPHVLVLSPEAKAAWVPFYNRLQDEKEDAESDIKAVLAKLEGYAARFALIHHVATEVGAGRTPLVPVGKESVEAGIELAEWFNQEARRIYAFLAETDEDREHRDLIDWIRGRGGRCTTRQLQRACGSRYRSADEAEAALDELAAAGFGAWHETPKPNGGWARRELVLHTDADNCDTRPDAEDDSPADPSDTLSATPENPADMGASVASVGVGFDMSDDPEKVSPELDAGPDSTSVGDEAANALDTGGNI